MPGLVSVNVGLPREVTSAGRPVLTGIFKSPVAGSVAMRQHNLDGDAQADLSVHGGPTKAIYVYPSRHYDYWRRELGESDLPWGSFGENFTVDGLDEEDTCIGDQFSVGGGRVAVTEPRMPCFKLGIRFGRADMVRRFLSSQRMGFYFAVLEEGVVQAGDELKSVIRHPNRLRVADVIRLYTTERTNVPLLRKASAASELPERWRGYFKAQIERLRGQ